MPVAVREAVVRVREAVVLVRDAVVLVLADVQDTVLVVLGLLSSVPYVIRCVSFPPLQEACTVLAVLGLNLHHNVLVLLDGAVSALRLVVHVLADVFCILLGAVLGVAGGMA